MLMLSVEGWINGLTAVGIFAFGGVLGIFFIYQSRKTNAKLLMYLSILLLFSIVTYWGVCFDFFTLLISDTILFPQGSTVEDIRNFSVWMWGGLIPLLGIYIGTTLLVPHKKWYFLSIVLILISFFEIFLILDVSGTIETIYEHEIPLGRFIPGTIAHIIIMILIFSVLIFNVGGFSYKTIQSTGIIRKKFFLLSVGFFFFIVFLSIEGLFSVITILIFTRIGLIISYWIIYLGLREEPEKPQENIKKEIKVESDLFRLIQNRPSDITEEEVSISKEKKICLVCKGKVGGFSFICDECGSFYCENCAKVMINLENICWACNTPIDPTKPSKPYENDKEGIKLKKGEETKKQLKV